MKRFMIALVLWLAAMAFVTTFSLQGAEPVAPTTTEIKLVIQIENMAGIEAAFKGVYPIPMIDDRENEDQQIPEFTDREWVGNRLDYFVQRTEARWALKQGLDAAKAAVTPDPTLIQSVTIEDK